MPLCPLRSTSEGRRTLTPFAGRRSAPGFCDSRGHRGTAHLAAAPAVTKTRRGSAARRSGAGRAAAWDGSGACPCPPTLGRRGVPAGGTRTAPSDCPVNVSLAYPGLKRLVSPCWGGGCPAAPGATRAGDKGKFRAARPQRHRQGDATRAARPAQAEGWAPRRHGGLGSTERGGGPASMAVLSHAWGRRPWGPRG